MYKIILLLLIPYCVSAQDFRYKQNITQTLEINISQERDRVQRIEADKFGNRICIVEFDAEVDGRWHRAKGSYTWDGGRLDDQACATAAMQARKNLTKSVNPVKLSSTQTFVYEENSNTKKIGNYKVGDIVDVSALNLYKPYENTTAAWQGTRCKWYDYAKLEEKLKRYNLIACKLPAGWTAVRIF